MGPSKKKAGLNQPKFFFFFLSSSMAALNKRGVGAIVIVRERGNLFPQDRPSHKLFASVR